MSVRCFELCLVGLLAAVAACSDSPGPASKGASHMTARTSGCGSGPFTIPRSGTPTTTTVAGARLVDGSDGDVDCSVKKSGEGYTLSGELQQGALGFAVRGHVDPVSDGVFEGSGSAGFYHPDAGGISSETCILRVESNQEIGTGKVWGTVSCGQSRKDDAPGFACDFGGAFLFENCN